MKKTILICAGLFLLFGCAKKQIVKPTVTEEVIAPPPVVKEEPPIRYADWSEVPQLQAINFDYDRYELRAEAREILKKNAEYLAGNADVVVLVEGHCDERGTIAYNLALGQKRAAAVREYYGNLGVSLGRVGTISYGSEKPVDPAHSESAWAKNRRVDTKIRNK